VLSISALCLWKSAWSQRRPLLEHSCPQFCPKAERAQRAENTGADVDGCIGATVGATVGAHVVVGMAVGGAFVVGAAVGTALPLPPVSGEQKQRRLRSVGVVRPQLMLSTERVGLDVKQCRLLIMTTGTSAFAPYTSM